MTRILNFAVISLCLVWAHAVHASDLFYVELGKAKSLKQAEEQWRDLLDAHTALLEDVEFYPHQAIHEGRNRYVHIYAGPIEDRGDAITLCRKLFREGASCFIVEGLPTYTQKMDAVKEQEPVLPWLAENAQEEPGVAEDTNLLPWIAGAGNQKEQDIKPEETQVEVAEAIRVPLSDTPAKKEAKDSFWAVFEPFPTGAEAGDAWQRVRQESSAIKRAMRGVVRYVGSNMNGHFTLSVGALDDEMQASLVCDKLLDLFASDVICTALAHEHDVAVNNPTLPSERAIQKKEASGSYWVQLATDTAPQVLELRWKMLQEEHSDIFSGLDYRVERSDAGLGAALQVGSFSSRDEATQFCYKLKQHGVDCQIFGGL